jgi:1-pyrroline-5-carboxylate dehydrogenase
MLSQSIASKAAKAAATRNVVATSNRSVSTKIPEWATCDPQSFGVDTTPHAVNNMVDGKWISDTKSRMEFPDPMDKNAPPIFTIPDTQADEVQPFIDSLRKVPKSGMHNPLKNPERYVQYGEIARRVCFFFWSTLLLVFAFNLDLLAWKTEYSKFASVIFPSYFLRTTLGLFAC